MSISVNYLYMFCLALIKKNQSGTLSPSNFEQFWNDESNAYMSDLLGRFQRINNGKEGNNTGLIENETIMTKLSPFTNPATITVSGGNANKPDDFIYALALRVNGYEVYMINKGQIQSVNGSVIDPPSETDNKYYGTEYLNYYTIFPNTVTELNLDYIKKPIDIVWGSTLDGNDRKVYDSGLSTQTEWDDISAREITKRMLKNIGVSLSERDLQNFSQGIINTGN